MTPTVGQFTVSPTSAVQAAATQIASTAQSPAEAAGLVPAYRQAKIVSYDAGTPPTCTVTFDGTTNVSGVQFLESYLPAANDIVVCIALNGISWILGALATAPPGHVNYWSGTRTSTLSVADASYVDYGGLTVTSSNEGDGAIYSDPWFTSHRAGIYAASITATFGSSAAGATRMLDWLTLGSSVIARYDAPIIGNMRATCTVVTYLPGAGYQIKPRIYQDSGSSMTLAVNTSATPQSATFVQLA